MPRVKVGNGPHLALHLQELPQAAVRINVADGLELDMRQRDMHFLKVRARVSTCSAHALRKVRVCILLKWAINMKHRTSEIDRELGRYANAVMPFARTSASASTRS